MNKKVGIISAGHLITDIYQGALPAMLPFIIANRNLSYAAAALIIFSANISSSIIQPLFGIYSDRISIPWTLPFGVLCAGIGIGLSGITSNYYLLLFIVALSGIGVASYHPEGARLANKLSGKNKGAGVSTFAAGGNIGFAVGPMITTAILLASGLKGTLLLSIPAIIMGSILIWQLPNFSKLDKDETIINTDFKKIQEEKSIDEWRPFSRLTLTLLCRSIIFFGLNTFLPLYWIHVLKQSEVSGSIALSTLIIVGAFGTLMAGRLADKVGNKKIILIGYSCLIPLMLIFINLTNSTLAGLILIPLGLALYAPYSPMVVLGQKYLPNHMGLASGVTMGLAVTMGGLVSPILGWISDNHGIHTAISCLVIMPFIAVALAIKLPKPKIDSLN